LEKEVLNEKIVSDTDVLEKEMLKENIDSVVDEFENDVFHWKTSEYDMDVELEKLVFHWKYSVVVDELLNEMLNW